MCDVVLSRSRARLHGGDRRRVGRHLRDELPAGHQQRQRPQRLPPWADAGVVRGRIVNLCHGRPFVKTPMAPFLGAAPIRYS